MKYLLILLLIISLPCLSQDKMGFGNDPDGADSAGFGTVTTWIKPSGEITVYSGELIVGNYHRVSLPYILDLYGYVRTSDPINIGYLNPEIDYQQYIGVYYVIDNEGVNDLILESYSDYSITPPFNSSANLEYIKINSDTLHPEWSNECFCWTVLDISNPFPSVGDTCSIEIKYTLP